MPLSDTQIKRLIDTGHIRYAHSGLTETGVLSYGVSSYGYDPRLGTKFKIMEAGVTPLDPKQELPPYAFRDFESSEPFVIPANTFFMGYTEEWFNIPRNTLVHVTGKSTYARLGLSTYVTPLEPGWTGHVTLEFRTAERPIVIYPGEGICQFVFLDATSECETSYVDRNGKYMDQGPEVAHHRVKENSEDAPFINIDALVTQNQLRVSALLEEAQLCTDVLTDEEKEQRLNEQLDILVNNRVNDQQPNKED